MTKVLPVRDFCQPWIPGNEDHVFVTRRSFRGGRVRVNVVKKNYELNHEYDDDQRIV